MTPHTLNAALDQISRIKASVYALDASQTQVDGLQHLLDGLAGMLRSDDDSPAPARLDGVLAGMRDDAIRDGMDLSAWPYEGGPMPEPVHVWRPAAEAVTDDDDGADSEVAMMAGAWNPKGAESC